MTDLVEVVVDHLGSRGDGVVTGEDSRLYVDGALAGERVQVRLKPGASKGDARAELIEVLEASPDRVVPPCPHAVDCGGCRLQHLSLPAFSGFLADKIRFALSARGLEEVQILPVERSPPRSRRRVRLAWQHAGGRTQLGMRMARSHRIVDLQTCLVADERLVALLPQLRALLARLSVGSGEVALDANASGVDVLLIAPKAVSDKDRGRIAEAMPMMPQVCRVSWRAADRHEAEPILVQSQPMLQHGPLRVPLAPGGFRQATGEGEAAMLRFLNQNLGQPRHVLDLFGGTGALGLGLDPLPRRLQVFENNPAAVEALTLGLRGGVKGTNITVARRDLETEPLGLKELRGVDAVILDPPRAGAVAQSVSLAASLVPRIGYVSCDPGSFARDARTLVDGGYALRSVLPIGQFLWSDEVELVALFSRDAA